jgi:hypothetical protein
MPPYRTLLTAFLCIAILVMRIGSAHLHLCMDGQEPPASIQFGDSSIASGSTSGYLETGPALLDYDYDLAGGTLSKLAKFDFALVALLFAFPLLLLMRRRVRTSLSTRMLSAHLFLPRSLRPPPCGPPPSFVI